jgi:hypothetical protein
MATMLVIVNDEKQAIVKQDKASFDFRGHQMYLEGLKICLMNMMMTSGTMVLEIPNFQSFSSKHYESREIFLDATLKLFAQISIIKHENLTPFSKFNDYPHFCELIDVCQIDWKKLHPYGKAPEFALELDKYTLCCKLYKDRKDCTFAEHVKYDDIWNLPEDLFGTFLLANVNGLLRESTFCGESEQLQVFQKIYNQLVKWKGE